MNSLPPFDKQIAQEQVRKVYQGELTMEETKQLQLSLEEYSDDWEQFFVEPKAPHELEPDEADVLLQAVLRETESSRKHLKSQVDSPVSQSSPAWWQVILQSWQRWAVLPAALAFLVVIALPKTDTWTPKGSLKAFINLKIHRHSQQNIKKFRVIPFKQNGYYKIGDAFLFRFLVIEKGYLYLYRQDIKGNLEQLFPFKGADHRFYEAGHHDLMQGPDKPLAYFLDRKLKGHQTFWLVHSDKPMTLPNHWKKLSAAQQRKLLRDSDRIRVTVFSR